MDKADKDVLRKCIEQMWDAVRDSCAYRICKCNDATALANTAFAKLGIPGYLEDSILFCERHNIHFEDDKGKCLTCKTTAAERERKAAE